MVVDAQVTPSTAGWTLELATRYGGANNSRTLQARSCQALGDALATVVAVALEPDVEDAASDDDAANDPPARAVVSVPPVSHKERSPVRPSPTPSPAQSPAQSVDPIVAAPAPDIATDDRPPRPRPPAPTWALRPIVGLEYGALPGVTAHLGLATGVLWPRILLQVEAGWLAPRIFSGPATTTARAQMFVVAGHGCLRLPAGPVEVPLCAGLEGGLVRAAPVELAGGRAVTGPWLGPSARGGVVYAFDRIGLWADVGAVVRGWATQLELVDTVAFTPRVLSLRVAAGVEFFFGGGGRDRSRGGHKP